MRFAPGVRPTSMPAAPVRPGVKPTITGAPATPITPKPMGGISGMRPPGPAPMTGGPKPMGGISGMRPPGPAPMTGGPKPMPMMKKGGKVSSASKRADGCAIRGKTKGKMV